MRLKVACGIAEALDYCSTKGFTTSFSNLSANSILFDDVGLHKTFFDVYVFWG